jgi:hypothetical protein
MVPNHQADNPIINQYQPLLTIVNPYQPLSTIMNQKKGQHPYPGPEILQAVEGPWHMQHAAAAWRAKLGQGRGAPGDQQQPCRA